MRLVVIALVASLAVPADAAPRRGRIVRVERPRTSAHGVPRICQYNPGDMSAACYGLPPRPGEIGTVVATKPDAAATTGVRGQVRVKSVEPTSPGGSGSSTCSSGLWKSELDLQTEATIEVYGAWVLFDVGLTDNASLLDKQPDPLPSGDSREMAAVTVDREGDGAADFLVTWFPCEASTQTQGSSQTYCIKFWRSGGEYGSVRWTLLREDKVTWCM